MTKATIDTDKGAIEIELSTKGAPKATANFIELAGKGFYDGVVFHRLVPGFVIQGGDGEYGHVDRLDRGRLGTGGPGYKFADEPFEGDYVRGAVAMANAGPNTNGSQFFICLADLSGGRLPKKYTLFGHVTSGMDAVDAIAAAKRDGRDQPNEPTAMRKVTIAE
jgi:cyclophilin family peptidyl-prolyl cis-trans isomerase